MTGHGAKLPRMQEAAIAALIDHQGNIAEAAGALKISVRTLRRWMQLPGFDNDYRRARQDIVKQAHARIQQNAAAAAAVLLKLMADPTTPASVSARISQYILESSNKLHETEKLEQGDAQSSQFEAKLRGWALNWRVDEEAFLQAAKGHEEELRRELRDDGTVTRPTFLLLREIAVQVATGAPAGPRREESK